MILFFFRRYNDLDHIVPIVYKMAKNGMGDIALICLNHHYFICSDFRLRFLKKNFDVDVRYVIKYNKKNNILQRALAWMICRDLESVECQTKNKSIRIKAQYYFHLVAYKILNRFGIDRHVLKNYFGKEWSKGFFEDKKCRCLIFDSAMHNNLYNYSAIRSEAKNRNIPIVFVPHGLSLIKLASSHAKKVFNTLDEADPDYIIVPHRDSAKEHMANISNPEKIAVLGSARFCQEWKNVLAKITPEQPMPFEEQGKINVVYFARSPGRCGKYKQLISDTLANIADLDFVNFIIKPHTRSNVFEFSELKEKVKVGSSLHSLNLINWADVVIGTISSITIDVFIAGKPFLYPEYFMYDDPNFNKDFIFSGGYSVMKDTNQLIGQLKKIYHNSARKKILRDHIVAKLVSNGDIDKDVLKDYERFIIEKAIS